MADSPPHVSSSIRWGAGVPIHKLDSFLSHLHRLLRTRDGHDTTLLFLAYAANLSAAILEIFDSQDMRRWAKKVAMFPPLSFASLHSSTALRLQLSSRFRALGAMLNDWHAMCRLWGLVGMWVAAKDLITKEAPTKHTKRQRVGAVAGATQILSLSSFFLLEAIALLSKRNILTWSPKVQARLILWCIRSWSVYVFVALGRLLFDRRHVTAVEERREWNGQFMRALAWAPLTVHWTRPGGFLPDVVAAGLATYPVLKTVQDIWNQTSKEV